MVALQNKQLQVQQYVAQLLLSFSRLYQTNAIFSLHQTGRIQFQAVQLQES